MTGLNGSKRVKILTEAMPYIQQYNGKTVVVKYGGAAMEKAELREAIIDDIILLSLVGIRLVLVHGGGPEINSLLNRLEIRPRFIDGLRYTDAETMDVVQMVLSGKVNKTLVSQINRRGGKALGLSGQDGNLFAAKLLNEDYGLVGEVVATDPKPVIMALDNGYIPVISTVASGTDADTAYNINADIAAAKLSVELEAEKLFLLTDVPGILRNPNDPATLIPEVTLSELRTLERDGTVSKGMIPKVDCCVNALENGVKRAVILDGRTPHSLLVEMLTDDGVGTQIVNR
ncbi:MAG: acetylglutamate kinase [Oscillospiraceae bacterium]|jgi:acetylglutamate kinase|nr:acetylglutamate kinase [Oscillospiraceae bacterium]